MEELTAQDIMTKDVVTITKDSTIGDLSKLLISNKISGVPVIDEKGTLVGMVTDGDIITEDISPVFPYYIDPLIMSYSFIENIEQYQKDMKGYLETSVEEIMTRKVRSVKIDTHVSEVAKIMVRNKINRVPVVDDDNKLLGIIARDNIIKSMVEGADKEQAQ
ncbi:MAG: CBS domain-containing protein [Candidatus Humimicrobiaceae bacterium]